jgi:thymidine phosphorylase
VRCHQVTAERSGKILSIDAKRISALARLAGAPADSLAGIDLARTCGDTVSAGEALYSVQAVDGIRLAEAVAAAHVEPGVRLG